MRRWIIGIAGSFLSASTAMAGPGAAVDRYTSNAIDWCESVAQRVAAVQPAAELRAAAAAVRAYAAASAPLAMADQQRELGLALPTQLDPNRPLVVLMHGLDMDRGQLLQMAALLTRAGQQVATFGFPADGPIADDAALLGRDLTRFSASHPAAPLNLIAYSMGSLVAREYVEGPAYSGHVNHLILLAPPNHGSGWAAFEPVLKARHDVDQSRTDPQWHASWIVTEGMCEAADDLLPHSSFLQQLNARPRRAGVQYTIVEGDEHVLRRLAANALSETAGVVAAHLPPRPATLTMELALSTLAAQVRRPHDHGDGAVTLHSAELAGVSDVVTVHADHGTIFWPDALGNPPAALAVIEARLRQ